MLKFTQARGSVLAFLNIHCPRILPLKQTAGKISQVAMQHLTKQKALELIPFVVDGEVNPDVYRAFLEYIELDPEVKRIYESQCKIKKLISTRCKKAKTPDHLRSKILQLIEYQEYDTGRAEIIDMKSPEVLSPGTESNHSSTNNARTTGRRFLFVRMAAAAVAIILLVLFTIEMLERFSPTSQTPMSIEEFAFSHFEESDGRIAFAGLQIGSITEAQQHLLQEYNIDINMPTFEGSELKQVIYTDFVPDYKTPILEYYQPDLNEYIYVFAFKIDSLNKYKKLARDPEAVEKCNSYDDFHIKEINDKHVVSWKWGENWYAAISNHNGYDLAAIVQPMNDIVINDN